MQTESVQNEPKNLPPMLPSNEAEPEELLLTPHQIEFGSASEWLEWAFAVG